MNLLQAKKTKKIKIIKECQHIIEEKAPMKSLI